KRKQQRRLKDLELKIGDKFKELARTIELRKKKDTGFEDALAVVKTDEGKKIMDEARTLIQEMKDEENDLLRQRNAEAELRNEEAAASARTTKYTIGIGSLLAVLFVSV